MKEGPPIAVLTNHLSACPESFLAEPVQPSGQGQVDVGAVISDLCLELGGATLSEAQIQKFRYSSIRKVRLERNRLRLILLASWLLFQKELSQRLNTESVLKWLGTGLDELSELVAADMFVEDSERREEFCRLCLAAQELLPEGEKPSEAENRLSALSTVERERVVRQAREAEERARKVREEMAAKRRAQQAASTYSRE